VSPVREHYQWPSRVRMINGIGSTSFDDGLERQRFPPQVLPHIAWRPLPASVAVSWFTGFLYFVLYFTPLILTLITKLIVGLRRRLFSCTSPTFQLYWNTITYSRLPFSWRLQELSSVCFHSGLSLIYITPGNTLIYCT
jgi:hypothetical protein